MTEGQVTAPETTTTAPVEGMATEAQVAEAPQAPAQRDQLISQMFAANAKLERELRELRTKAKQAVPEIDPELKKLAEMKRKAKANPMAWLEAAGLTYDEITEYQLNGGRPEVPEAVLTLQEEIEQLKKDKAREAEERQKEMQAKMQEAEIAKIKASVLQHKDKFELTSFHDDHIQLVKDVMEEAKETGRELSVDQAAGMVEKYLEDMARQFSTLPKLRKIFGAVDVANNQDQAHTMSQEPQIPTSNAAKTLTHSMTQAGTPTHDREMTDDERRAKAAELLKFI